MPEPIPAKRPRDRESAERVILQAAKDVLAEEGFQGFGVNAIARAAGYDKQLVYRYFGGAEGLIDAIGADLADWWAQQLTPGAPPAKTYGELMLRLALGLLEALRGDRLVQKIAAWEVSDASPQVARLSAARSKGMTAWLAAQRGKLRPPDGLDSPAINAVLIAGVQHLVLASSTSGVFAGAPLKTEAHWDRIRAAVTALVRAVYPE